MSEMDKPLTKDEIIETLAKNPVVSGRKIVFTPRDRVEELKPWVERVLEAIHLKNAWVSDRTMIRDFCMSRERLADVEDKLNLFGITNNDFIVDVARRLKEAHEKKGDQAVEVAPRPE